MSVDVGISELEDLKDVPVLEGELEWVISVIDGDNCSKQEHCFPTKTGYAEQE